MQGIWSAKKMTHLQRFLDSPSNVDAPTCSRYGITADIPRFALWKYGIFR